MIKNVTRIGLPYHGLVVNDILRLPNTQSIRYPGITNGDTQLVAIPHYQNIKCNPEQAEFDKKKGLQWKNYALVTDNRLGGVDIGPDWLLYIDANQVVWYLKLGYSVISNQRTMSCTLQSVFGRFDKKYPTIGRQLVQDVASFNIAGTLLPMNRFTFERNSTGSEVLIHLYARLFQDNAITFPEEMTLCEIWKLELEGNGELAENADLGKGISARLSKFKSIDEIRYSNKNTIKKAENQFRLGQVNIKSEYDPGPTKPPECKSNTLRTSYTLAMVPADDNNLVPFDFDRNTYVQTNWYGQEETKLEIVRMLFDSSGGIHTIEIQREYKKLNRYYQQAEGSGTVVRGPIQYILQPWGVCVEYGRAPTNEKFNWTQTMQSQFKVVKSVSLILDGAIVDEFTLEGKTESASTSTESTGTLSSVNISAMMNDQAVRQISGKSGQVSNAMMSDPFSGNHHDDDKKGVYGETYFGFLSNNLVGLFIDRYVASDIKKVTEKRSGAVLGPGKVDNDYKIDFRQFYLKGSFESVSQEIIRYQDGRQGWV